MHDNKVKKENAKEIKESPAFQSFARMSNEELQNLTQKGNKELRDAAWAGFVEDVKKEQEQIHADSVLASQEQQKENQNARQEPRQEQPVNYSPAEAESISAFEKQYEHVLTESYKLKTQQWNYDHLEEAEAAWKREKEPPVGMTHEQFVERHKEKGDMIRANLKNAKKSLDEQKKYLRTRSTLCRRWGKTSPGRIKAGR